MNTEEKLQAKQMFQERLHSLSNDAKRAYWKIEGVASSPFPIAMYIFATIDYFSSFWAGWNNWENRSEAEKKSKRSQTDRIVDFMERYLLYPKRNSKIAITIWRHKLMHTGEPRLLKSKDKDEYYGWLIDVETTRHMHLVGLNKKEYQLQVGVFNLIKDLQDAIFSSNGYFVELLKEKELQRKWIIFKKELSEYRIN